MYGTKYKQKASSTPRLDMAKSVVRFFIASGCLKFILGVCLFVCEYVYHKNSQKREHLERVAFWLIVVGSGTVVVFVIVSRILAYYGKKLRREEQESLLQTGTGFHDDEISLLVGAQKTAK